jgi:hypothetical protein
MGDLAPAQWTAAIVKENRSWWHFDHCGLVVMVDGRE